MDLMPSDDERLFAESVDGWLAKHHGFAQWRELSGDAVQPAAPHWRTFAEMGWLGLTVPEEYGGVAAGPGTVMLLAERVGRALIAEPVLSTLVLATTLLVRAGPDAVRREWLTRIVDGTAILAVAVAERGARFAPTDTATTASRDGSGFLLSGRKVAVLDAPLADRLIVLARTGGSRGDEIGLGLFIVDPSHPSVALRSYRTLDRRWAAEVVLDRTPAEAVLGDPDGALPAVEAALDGALAFLAAEAVGAMSTLIDATVAYTRERRQFGRAIGDFQAVQHRVADMLVKLEEARSLALHAGLAQGRAAAERSRASSAAKVQTGISGRFVGQNAVQLHGGMGMTDDLAVGHYMKRLMVIDMLYGAGDEHVGRFAAKSALCRPADP